MTLESRQFRSGPHDWHVISGGTGPLALFLHGAGASAESMAPVMEAMSERWTVVAPDLPGHGGTRLGSSARSGLPEMAVDVAAMIAQAYSTPMAVIGHSAGAAIALELDVGMVPRVLINPALAPFDGAAGWVFPRLARALSAAPFATSLVSRSFAKQSRIQGLLAETGSPVTDEAVARYQRLATNSAHIRGTLMMMAAWDVVPLRNRLPRIEAPALFVLGTNDKTVSPDIGRLEAGRMPAARIREVSGGHLVHEEDPSGIAAMIEAFLTSV